MGPRVIAKTQYFDFNRDKLYGDERMKFILVKDTTDFPGFNLFKTILNLYCKSDLSISLLCLDGPAKDIISGLNFNQDKFVVNDEFLTLWNNKQPISVTYFDKLLKHEGLLCIYSLTSLIIQESSDGIYRFLYKLLNENSKLQVLALVHEDVHSNKEIAIFDNLATSVIDASFSDDYNKFLITTSTTNKAYGQIIYDYEVSPTNFTFISVNEVLKHSAKPMAKKPDPTANLTFNLNLNEKEKKARGQLQMPYTKTEVMESITTQDLEDFYEEEDPDDDLGYLEAV
ncbi:elongator complex protein 5 [Parasteatoda tepidariorum]|uniref:elongator complex protein 5 n=1 Tax=Parasteatoda tepidariorum TaxID=114398 RepID=UPI001C7248A9|nr:elongator complex protein 5 [Parasteatoda tepidariorum]